MKVKEIMTENVVTCSPDDMISSVLAKMKANKIHQLPVLNKKQIAGIIILDNIVKKEIDPTSTKVSTLMSFCPVVSPEANTEDAIELILGSNIRALPVYDTELRGILSENDIVKNVKIDSDLQSKEAISVEEKDNVGKVKKIMTYENISRVPVVKNGKCVGIVGTMELIKILEGKQSFASSPRMKDRGYKNPINIDETLVTAIMREPVLLKAGAKKDQILEKLRQDEEVLIENGSLKIITPKDVLRTLVKPRKMVYVQITGLDKNDADYADKTHKEAELTLKKISRATEVQPLKIMVEKHKKEGSNKTKYSVSAQLPTQLGTFISTKAYGWKYVTVMQQSLKNIEREFFKKFEKQITQKKKGRMKG